MASRQPCQRVSSHVKPLTTCTTQRGWRCYSAWGSLCHDKLMLTGMAMGVEVVREVAPVPVPVLVLVLLLEAPVVHLVQAYTARCHPHHGFTKAAAATTACKSATPPGSAIDFVPSKACRCTTVQTPLALC